MIWINFAKWNNSAGRFLTWERVYRKGYIWTPFCHIRKRYNTWLGFWKKPDPMCWLLADRTITFAGVPSDMQEQAAVDLAKSLGLVPTGQVLASCGMLELFLEPGPSEPEWQITVPDGHGATASITYKGKRVLGITNLTYILPADGWGQLTLSIHPNHLEAATKIIRGTMEIVEEECE